MRRSNCAGAMEYVPELTWLLFLRILDEREIFEVEEAAAVGASFTPSIESPYRWQDWASSAGAKRKQLQEAELGAFFSFLHNELLPYLRGLKDRPGATSRQKIVGEILADVQQTRVDTEYNMWEVIDRVDQIRDDSIDPTHVFPLSQVYEGLLLKMGEKRNDGGQFFTPREVIRAMVETIDPKVGQIVYDPACGTGGFLAQSYEYMNQPELNATDIDDLKNHTFYGREKDNTVFPIALANLVLHGIDSPNLWHGNTLSGQEVYADLYQDAPQFYDVILTNPPFGGKEGKEAQTRFDYKTGSTQVLFLQHVISNLAEGGKCGIVIDEGVLFRTNESAFVKTKKKLLDECKVWCIISLPGGVFTQAGAGVKTNIFFFTKGEPTDKIWYYDLSHLKIRKRTPLTIEHFNHFFEVLPNLEDSDYSWTVDIDERKIKAVEEAAPLHKKSKDKLAKSRPLEAQLSDLKKQKKSKTEEYEKLQTQIKAKIKEARELENRAQAIEDAVYDLKAVNPNIQIEEDLRTPEELIAIIEEQSKKVIEALASLRDS